MKTAQLFVSSLALFGVPMFVACDHEHHTATANDVHHGAAYDDVHHAPTARTTGAVRDIVAARCEREERCDNVGPDKTYASHAACTSKLEGSTADDINLKDCKNGVDDAKLHECLSKIHGRGLRQSHRRPQSADGVPDGRSLLVSSRHDVTEAKA